MAKEMVTQRKYSDEDKQAFAEKDLKIVRQSCLNRATELAIYLQVDGKEIINTVKVWAESLADYVYNGITAPPATTTSPEKKAAEAPKKTPPTTDIPPEGSQPKPSEASAALIAQILQGYEVPDGYRVSTNRLTRAIFKKYGKYPTRANSVAKILAEIPVVEVIEEV